VVPSSLDPHGYWIQTGGPWRFTRVSLEDEPLRRETADSDQRRDEAHVMRAAGETCASGRIHRFSPAPAERRPPSNGAAALRSIPATPSVSGRRLEAALGAGLDRSRARLRFRAMSDSPHAAHTVAMTGDDQRIARLAGGALVVLGSCSLVGVACSLYLVNHAPLLLVALSPIGRHLLLAAPITDPRVFLPVVIVRRMLFYLACFYLGRALGPPGVLWVEARAGRLAPFVRWLERVFGRHGAWLVLLLPSPSVSALAGISGMRTGRFVALAVPGLIVRVLLIVGFAEWLRGPIELLLAWIDAHWVPGTIALVIGVAGQQAWRWRRMRRTAALQSST